MSYLVPLFLAWPLLLKYPHAPLGIFQNSVFDFVHSVQRLGRFCCCCFCNSLPSVLCTLWIHPDCHRFLWVVTHYFFKWFICRLYYHFAKVSLFAVVPQLCDILLFPPYLKSKSFHWHTLKSVIVCLKSVCSELIEGIHFFYRHCSTFPGSCASSYTTHVF